MYLRGCGSDWEIRAPAKVNLLLEVLSRRGDGFHEIETLMVPISLYDTLVFSARPVAGFALRCEKPRGTLPPPWDAVSDGADNLVIRALTLLAEEARIEGGAAVRLIKRIPPGAGMGGGSSDAAAALIAAHAAWRLGWSRARLLALAADIGSDVPFFLQGGAAICRGRGEIIEPVAGLPSLPIVVAWPGESLATADVYRACLPGERDRAGGPLVDALRCGRLSEAARRMRNSLEHAATGLSSCVGRLKRIFARLDCVAYQMTGSGTAWFAICRTARHARRVAAELRASGIAQVDCVVSCPRGC